MAIGFASCQLALTALVPALSLVTGDASSKLVEAYRLHPNAVKGLARCGQGYLLNDEGIRPVVYGMLPNLACEYPLAARAQRNARGLSLYEQFVRPRGAMPGGLQPAAHPLRSLSG